MARKMENCRCLSLSGLFLGIGLALCGLFLGKSLEKAVFYLKSNNIVHTKGLVEQVVKSDTGSVNISVSFVGNEIEELLKQATACQKELRIFLTQNRIQNSEISEKAIDMTDKHKDFIPSKYQTSPAKDRYEVKCNFSIRSLEVEKIDNLYKKSGEFITSTLKVGNADVRVFGPHYEYTKLENIRAEMISESTKSARKIADQFAKDSECTVGKISWADQGSVQLIDIGDGLTKTARIVSYVNFLLR